MSKKTDQEREDISEDAVQELVALVEIPDAFMFQSIMAHPANPDVFVAFAPMKSEGYRKLGMSAAQLAITALVPVLIAPPPS